MAASISKVKFDPAGGKWKKGLLRLFKWNLRFGGRMNVGKGPGIFISYLKPRRDYKNEFHDRIGFWFLGAKFDKWDQL